MRESKQVGLPHGVRIVRLERVLPTPELQGYWRVWHDSSKDGKCGNFMQLNDDGSVEHVHINNQMEHTFPIRDADGVINE
jgi:hypothetical protein